MYKNFNYFILIFVLILRQGSGIISALHLSLFLSHLFLTFSFSLSSSLHFFHEAIIAEHTFVRDPFIVGWLAGWLPPQTCKKAASSLTLSHTHTSQPAAAAAACCTTRNIFFFASVYSSLPVPKEC